MFLDFFKDYDYLCFGSVSLHAKEFEWTQNIPFVFTHIHAHTHTSSPELPIVINLFMFDIKIWY